MIKKILLFPIKVAYRLLAALHFVNPTVIVLIDGGICSQMYQYLMGYYLKAKYGQSVEYNTVWYDVDGRDANGSGVRNFDLLKIFPHLDFTQAGMEKCKWYNRLFPYYGYSKEHFHDEWWRVTPPMTLLGYFDSPNDVYAPFNQVFVFKPEDVLDERNLEIYNNIPENSVAVHVRRGDLSEYRRDYGYPVTEQYYTNAIKHFYDIDPATQFYFFSDGMDYVRNTLLPSLPFAINSVVVENGDAKGYYDLVLISRCRHQITSKGSLGKYGALLSSSYEGKTVIVSSDDSRISMLTAVGLKPLSM
jgi:hypothetical protein